MGEYEEFRTAVQLISLKLKSFDFDINVSVFETTIRLLGGLLSAHLMAVDPELSIYVSRFIHYLLSLLLCLRNLTFFCMIYDVNYLLVLQDTVNRSYTRYRKPRSGFYNDEYYYNDAVVSANKGATTATKSSSSNSAGQNPQPFSRHRLILPTHQTRNGWPWSTALNDNNSDDDDDDSDDIDDNSNHNIDHEIEIIPVSNGLLKTNSTSTTATENNNSDDINNSSPASTTTTTVTNKTKSIKRVKVRSNQNPLVPSSSETHYDNWLLTLAIDLGERLLPAFHTNTGMSDCVYKYVVVLFVYVNVLLL